MAQTAFRLPRSVTVFIKIILIFGLAFGLTVSSHDSFLLRELDALFPAHFKPRPEGATKPYTVMWSSVAVFPLPADGAPWSFNGVELTQGVVFDESSRLDPPEGFKRGVWADVTVEADGASCRALRARAPLGGRAPVRVGDQGRPVAPREGARSLGGSWHQRDQ